MSRQEVTGEHVRGLLQDPELRVILDAPAGDYRLEYYTSAIADAQSEAARCIRTYRLVDLIRGGVTQEPWDRYDLDKQTMLVTNLIELGGYRVSKVTAGWKVKCPACGHSARGKIWEAVPTICAGKGSSKCRHKFTSDDVVEQTHPQR